MKTKIEFLIIFNIILLLLFVMLFFNKIVPKTSPLAVRGNIDLTNLDFKKDKVVKLIGEWESHYNVFLLPDSFNKNDNSGTRSYTNVTVNNRFNLGKTGYATHHLNVTIKKDSFLLAMRIPVIHSSYRLWIDDDLMLIKGNPGVLKRLTAAKEGPELVFFTPRSNQFQITIETANYHNTIFGSHEAIELGSADYLKRIKSNDEVLDGILFGSLLLLTILHIGMFLLRKNDRHTLYFSIFCLCIALRVIFTREHLILNFVPFYHFEVFKKIEYIAFFLTLPLLFLSIKDQFSGILYQIAFKIVSVLCLMLVLVVLLFPLSVYAYGLFLFHVLLFISLVFFLIYLFRTGKYKTNEAKLIISGLFFFILSLGLECYITKFYVASGYYTTVGFMLFIFTQSFIFIYKFARAFIESEMLSKKLQMYSHNLEKKVDQRTRELSEANAQKTRFFINLAHETKTPLTIIDNYLDKDIKVRGSSDSIKIVKDNVSKLKRDVFNFLDIEKIERGQVFYDHDQIVDLSSYIRTSVNQFGEVAKNYSLVINVDVEDNLYIKIDPHALDRIVNNLIDNAIKYTKSGGLINVCVRKLDDYLIELVIKDTGIGMPPDELDNVFKPYYQLNHSKRNTQGMGMGLSIVKSIIDEVDGEIKVVSRQGEGTGFTVMLKGHILHEDDKVSGIIVGDLIDHNPDLSLTTPLYDGNKYTIFIVEDNIELLSYLVKSLSDLFNVFFAKNGKEALTVINSIPNPHLIISDIMMDQMDGYTFYDNVSKFGEFNTIPFIFLSARTTHEDKLKGLKQGAIDYIYKPFSIDEVINKIESVLSMLDKHAQKGKKGVIKSIVKMLDDEGRDEVAVVNRKTVYNRFSFSRREIEIAELVIKGYQNKEIGGMLSISTRTVDTHIYKMYKKSGCSNRIEFMQKFE